MNKYYNDNDCANNIFELHANKFSGNHQFKSIAYLLGELLHDGMSMNDISKAITYDVADIVSMIVKCDNIAIFSVWAGGTEVNDHMLTIADALSKFDAYAHDGYDDGDLKIGAYTLEEILNRKCDNAFSQADFGDDADKIDENLEQGTVIDTEHGYNDGHIAIKKAIWFIDKDVTSGEQAPIAGYFTMFYSKNTVSFNVSFGTFEVDIINENSLKNS